MTRSNPARDLEKHIAAARDLVARGDERGAAIEFKNAIQLDPNNADLRWGLGQVYLSLGNLDQAAKEIDRAQQLGLRNSETTQALLHASAQRGDYQTALRVIKDMDDVDQRKPDVLAVQGDAALASGETEVAKQQYSEALSQDPDEVGALLGLARISAQHGDVAGARANLTRVLMQQPDNNEALVLQGLLFYQENNYPLAIDSFEQAAKSDPKDLNAKANLARALIAAQRFSDATKILDGLEESSRANPMIAFMRGQIAYHEQRIPEAQAAFTEVLLAAPNHAQSLWLLSHVLFLQNKLLEAEKHATKFVDLAPGFLPGAKLLAAIHLRRNEPAKAVELLQTRDAEGKQDAQFQLLLGSALIGAGEVEEGNRRLASAREIEPESAMLRTQQAIGQLAAGDIDKAMADLRLIADEAEPSNADQLLVYLNMERGDLDAALQASNALIAKQPDDALGYNVRGAVQVRRQDLVAARADFEQALRINPKFAPAVINLGHLERLAGNLAAAKQRYQQVIDLDAANVDGYLALAALAAADQDTASAVALLERALANNEAAVPPRLMLARHQLAIGNVENALQLLGDAVRYAPGNPQARFMLGEAQLAANDLATAKATFETLAAERPRAVEVKLQLAAIALVEQQRDRARSLIDEALALDPKNPGALAVLVRLNIASGDHDRAQAVARQIKESFPESSEGDVLLGDALLAAGKAREAMASYQHAAATAPSTTTTLRLFQAMRSSHDAARATALLDEWLQAHPGDLAIRNTRASLDLEQGDNSAAIVRYESVLKDSPEDITALNNLAFLYQKTDRKKSVEYAERAYKLAPNAYQVIDTYGWILVQQDKVSQGLELLRKAAARTSDPDVHYHLAAALAKAGSRDEARGELEALLAQSQQFSERRAAESLLALLK